MTLDENLVEAITRDYRTAPIEERDRVMLDYEAWHARAGADDARSLKVMFQVAF